MKKKKRYDDFQKLIQQKLNLLSNEVEEARREQAKFDSDYNLHLAAEKRQRQLQEKAHEAEINAKEMEAARNNIIYDEKLFKHEPGKKVVAYMYRGMDEDELKEIRDIQAQQRIENEIEKARKRDEDGRIAAQEANNHRALILIEREKERQARQIAVSNRISNQLKAESDKERKLLSRHEGPTEEYFAQFNKDCR